jgi:hypothetical protein
MEEPRDTRSALETAFGDAINELSASQARTLLSADNISAPSTHPVPNVLTPSSKPSQHVHHSVRTIHLLRSVSLMAAKPEINLPALDFPGKPQDY